MASISTFARNFAKGKNGQHSNFRKEFRERWAYPKNWVLLPHRSSAFGHLHTRAATRLLDLCSREDDSSLARSRRMESGRDPMTSASGKSRAVKDPARCSRAVNMTVTAAPVANGQRGERESARKKGSPRSKNRCRWRAAAGRREF